MKRIFNETKVVVAGTINNIVFDGDSAIAEITYADYDKTTKANVDKTEKITFHNSEKAKPVTIMQKHDINGSKVIVKAALKEGKLNGFDFQFPGNVIGVKYKDKNNAEKLTYFYFGKVNVFKDNLTNVPTKKGDVNCFKCSGSVAKRAPSDTKDKKKEYEYINITIWDNEKKTLAQNASKVLRKGDLVVMNISEIKEFTRKKDNSIGKSATAYSFDIVEKASDAAAKNTDDEAAEAETTAPAYTEPEEDVASTVFGDIDLDEDDEEDDLF